MAYGDQAFRHGLRNAINSLKLALDVCDRCPKDERADWMEMMVATADEAIALVNRNLPEGEGEEEYPQQD